MIVVAERWRNKIRTVPKVLIIPPWKGIDAEFLQDAQYREKDPHGKNQEDELFQVGSSVDDLDGEIEPGDVIEKEKGRPGTGGPVEWKDRRNDDDDAQ